MTVTSHEELLREALAHMDVLGSLRRKAFCAHPPHRDVSLPQLYILTRIQEHGRHTVSELAALLAISAPSASSILDRMEEHGLINRVRDEVDRRVVHVEITSPGSKAVDELGGLQRDRIRRLLETMSADELEQVIGGVEAITAALARLDLG